MNEILRNSNVSQDIKQKIEKHGLRKAMRMMTTMECWSLCVAIWNENTASCGTTLSFEFDHASMHEDEVDAEQAWLDMKLRRL